LFDGAGKLPRGDRGRASDRRRRQPE